MNKSIDELNTMISTGNIELYTKGYVDDLRQRIDKAIEYIEENKEKQFAYNYEYYLEDKEVESLLNILKGSEE